MDASEYFHAVIAELSNFTHHSLQTHYYLLTGPGHGSDQQFFRLQPFPT